MKVTAIAPASVALIKYWGRKDSTLRLPINGSIAVNLDHLLTTTTVEFSADLKKDSVMIDGVEKADEAARAIKHLDRIRVLGKIDMRAKVVSQNSFPSSTGLSSSSSGFAALTHAGSKAAGLDLSPKELSILARQGSGSSCRSIVDGFVEWLDGETSDTSYAVSLHPPEFWNIVNIVAIVSDEKKEISSSEGHETATTSPFFSVRVQNIRGKIDRLKQFIAAKDFASFGKLVEDEALEFHSITMTSNPSLLYLLPNSLRMMRQVQRWRQEGLQTYFNLNTGQDVHVLCEEKDAKEVEKHIKSLDCVRDTIVNRPSVGSRLTDKHLF